MTFNPPRIVRIEETPNGVYIELDGVELIATDGGRLRSAGPIRVYADVKPQSIHVKQESGYMPMSRELLNDVMQGRLTSATLDRPVRNAVATDSRLTDDALEIVGPVDVILNDDGPIADWEREIIGRCICEHEWDAHGEAGCLLCPDCSRTSV